MLLHSPKSVLFVAFAASLLCSVAVEAKPRSLGDLSNRSSVETMRFVTPMKTTEMNTALAGQRVEFGQWHGSFSSIGGKRSGVSLDNRSSLQEQMVNYPTVERKRSGIAIEASERQMAPLRNFDQVRDIVMARQFSDSAPRTTMSRTLQEMVDEVSLKDINRFQVHRNKTDDGIPVQRAGSREGPTVAPKREKAEPPAPSAE